MVARRYPSPFKIDKIRKLLSTEEVGLLSDAFSWAGTSQGHDYWSNVCRGYTPFNCEHRRIIEAWVKAYEEDNPPKGTPPKTYNVFDPQNWGV